MAPKLYLRAGCPFCTKTLAGLAELGVLADMTIEWDTEENRKYISDKAGKSPTFPTLEESEGAELLMDSGLIVEKYAAEKGVKVEDLVSYQMYLYLMKDYFSVAKGLGRRVPELRDEHKGKYTANNDFSNDGGPGLKSEKLDKPIFYSKAGCPFCVGFALFLGENGLLPLVDVKVVDDEDRAKLAEISGRSPTFPALQLEPDVIKYETNDLIAMCSKVHGVEREKNISHPFYMEGIFTDFLSVLIGLTKPKFLEAMELGKSQ